MKCERKKREEEACGGEEDVKRNAGFWECREKSGMDRGYPLCKRKDTNRFRPLEAENRTEICAMGEILRKAESDAPRPASPRRKIGNLPKNAPGTDFCTPSRKSRNLCGLRTQASGNRESAECVWKWIAEKSTETEHPARNHFRGIGSYLEYAARRRFLLCTIRRNICIHCDECSSQGDGIVLSMRNEGGHAGGAKDGYSFIMGADGADMCACTQGVSFWNRSIDENRDCEHSCLPWGKGHVWPRDRSPINRCSNGSVEESRKRGKLEDDVCRFRAVMPAAHIEAVTDRVCGLHLAETVAEDKRKATRFSRYGQTSYVREICR